MRRTCLNASFLAQLGGFCHGLFGWLGYAMARTLAVTCSVSGAIAMGKLRTADPADIF